MRYYGLAGVQKPWNCLACTMTLGGMESKNHQSKEPLDWWETLSWHCWSKYQWWSYGSNCPATGWWYAHNVWWNSLCDVVTSGNLILWVPRWRNPILSSSDNSQSSRVMHWVRASVIFTTRWDVSGHFLCLVFAAKLLFLLYVICVHGPLMG